MSAGHAGECTHLPQGYEALVSAARAVCDGLRYDPGAGTLVVAADIVARRDDLDVMTDLAEREVHIAREATRT